MSPTPILTIAALALSTAALAQPAPPASFEALDTNADGFITRQEAMRMPRLESTFHLADRNDNGLIEPPEFRDAMAELQASAIGADSASAGATAPAGALFRRLDRDGNGYLSDDELWSARGERGDWVAVDRNGDGRISPAEFIEVP